MHYPRRFLCLVACLLISCLGSLAHAGYHASAINTDFPDQLADLQFVQVIDYESQQPGLGIGLAYASDSAKADIYIYDYQSSSPPDDPQAPMVVTHFQQVIDDIYALQTKGIYQDVKLLEGPQQITVGRYVFWHAKLSLVLRGAPKISHVLLTVSNRQFLKVRYTYDAAAAQQDPWPSLLNSLTDLWSETGTVPTASIAFPARL